jgi:hypothetical protein
MVSDGLLRLCFYQKLVSLKYMPTVFKSPSPNYHAIGVATMASTVLSLPVIAYAYDSGRPGLIVRSQEATMTADGGHSGEALARFAEAGVDVDALAAKLQHEWAKSFANSWNDLMGVIAFKSKILEKAG